MCRFNSTLVLLKDAARYGNVCAYKFQFHAGSIKRRHQPAPFARALAGFNSTLVLLKGHRFALSGHRRKRFQFHAGSIKSLLITGGDGVTSTV